MFDGAYEIAPDLARHFVAGGDPPAAFVFEVGCFQDVGFAEFRFAPASAASEDFEAGWAPEDFLLPRVGHPARDCRRHIRCGCAGFPRSGPGLHSVPPWVRPAITLAQKF